VAGARCAVCGQPADPLHITKLGDWHCDRCCPFARNKEDAVVEVSSVPHLNQKEVKEMPKTIAQLIAAVDAAGSALTASAAYNPTNSTTVVNWSAAAEDYAGALQQLSRALDLPTGNLHQAGNQLAVARHALNDAQWPLQNAGSPSALIPYLQRRSIRL
jgi:hypothetical protein